MKKKKKIPGTSLVVQWLRHHTSNAGDPVWSLVRELDLECHNQKSSHDTTKDPDTTKLIHETTKTWHSQIS